MECCIENVSMLQQITSQITSAWKIAWKIVPCSQNRNNAMQEKKVKASQCITMYIKTRRDCNNIKACSPFQIRHDLNDKCFAIAYFSYTNVRHKTNMRNWIANTISKIYSSSSKDYNEINDDEYYSSFGLEKKNGGWENQENDKDKIEFAYNRAWENRYFEISDSEVNNEFSQLIIICLGIIFSIAWHYVIRGSKRWQENWEKHIDKLEDFISGPLYKTIFHKDTFYSVSKINEILSVVIIVVWFALLLNFLNLNNKRSAFTAAALELLPEVEYDAEDNALVYKM